MSTQKRVGLPIFALVCIVVLIHVIRGEFFSPYTMFYLSVLSVFFISVIVDSEIIKKLQVLFMVITGCIMSVEDNTGQYMGLIILAIAYAAYYTYGYLRKLFVFQTALWCVLGFFWFAYTSAIVFQLDITRAFSRLSICIAMVFVVRGLAYDFIEKARKLDERDKIELARAAMVLVKKEEGASHGNASER